MKLNTPSIGLLVALLVSVSACQKSADNSSASPAKPKGYTLSQKESKVLDALIKDDADGFSSGADSILQTQNKLTAASADEISAAYNDNQVAADQKFFKKHILLTGKINSINSGLNNEPYVVLRGTNSIMSPQVHFSKPNIDKISALKKGGAAVFVCDGGGSIVGTAMFKDCQFAEDYANHEIPKMKSDIGKFLSGAGIDSENLVLIVLGTIAVARELPDNSPCFTDSSKCSKDLASAQKAMTTENFTGIAQELRLSGVQLPGTILAALDKKTSASSPK